MAFSMVKDQTLLHVDIDRTSRRRNHNKPCRLTYTVRRMAVLKRNPAPFSRGMPTNLLTRCLVPSALPNTITAVRYIARFRQSDGTGQRLLHLDHGPARPSEAGIDEAAATVRYP